MMTVETEASRTPQAIEDWDQLILCACTSAANILIRRGMPREAIANGLLSFGGAMLLETEGAGATAEIFRSKADGLDGIVQ